jgi:uncharacterized RDD family membrane protein YckC
MMLHSRLSVCILRLLFFHSAILQISLLTGVDASAAQKAPVTKTCLQCGCVLPSNARACNFCDSSFSVELSSVRIVREDDAPPHAPEISVSGKRGSSCVSTTGATDEPEAGAWRGELGERVQAYRARRGLPPLPPRQVRAREVATQELSLREADQTSLPFAESAAAHPEESRHGIAIATAVDEPLPAAELTPAVHEEEFSFTIAIGRYITPPSVGGDGRMEIDVSVSPNAQREEGDAEDTSNVKHYGLYPVASLEDRRIAAVIDLVCLLFAYGGFMALFSSLGGQFSATKLNAVVYVATFAVVYLQYFALFTIFGGTTPGMMFRGLQVASFSGAPPSPRQYLLRSIGYVLSAAAVFAGFAWSWWDEDHLTWHDRISRTYLSSPTTRAAFHAPTAAHSR